MALDRLKYDVFPFTRELDELGSLFYVERLVVETNTNSTDITPTFSFESEDVVFSTISNSVRGMLEVVVNRLGPLNSFELTPVAGIDWYGVELFIRPVVLGVNVVESGARVVMPGRTNDSTSSLVFDINPFSFPEDARHINPIVRRLWVDIETGTNSVAPTLNFDDGTSSALTAITTSGRAITEYSVISAKRVKNLTLAGDFADGQVVLYDVELDVYLPSKRRMAVG